MTRSEFLMLTDDEQWDILWDLRGRSGVYTLSLYDMPLYIGRSCDLGNRLSHHARTKLFDMVSLEFTSSDFLTLASLEATRIHESHPPLNRVCPARCGYYGTPHSRTFYLIPKECLGRYVMRVFK